MKKDKRKKRAKAKKKKAAIKRAETPRDTDYEQMHLYRRMGRLPDKGATNYKGVSEYNDLRKEVPFEQETRPGNSEMSEQGSLRDGDRSGMGNQKD